MPLAALIINASFVAYLKMSASECHLLRNLRRTLKNAELLQFLDAVSQAEKYSELSDLETGILLSNYAKQQNCKEFLSSVLSGITGFTAKK